MHEPQGWETALTLHHSLLGGCTKGLQYVCCIMVQTSLHCSSRSLELSQRVLWVQRPQDASVTCSHPSNLSGVNGLKSSHNDKPGLLSSLTALCPLPVSLFYLRSLSFWQNRENKEPWKSKNRVKWSDLAHQPVVFLGRYHCLSLRIAPSSQQSGERHWYNVLLRK